MTNTREIDQRLVERVQKGDSSAFDLLVKKYQHRIIALISRYVNDHHEQQDVAQEAFLKAFRALKNFRGDSAFYTWMYRIAINTAKNHLVFHGRRPPGTDIELADAEVLGMPGKLANIDTPENNAMRDELEETLFAALEKLPEDLRVAISLRELEGLSYDEIATTMQCPVGTVRSRIFRAREYLDKAMQPLLDANL